MGWNQRHCEDYQILVRMTIHGSKSELERLRYHENWKDALIDAPQNSKSHNFWSDCWIFEFHTFLENENQDISNKVKISPISGGLRTKAGGSSTVVTTSIFAPDREDWHFFWNFPSTQHLSTFFLSSKHTHTHTKAKDTSKKHIKVSWFLHLHQEHKVLFLNPIFLSLVLHLGFGV